MTNIIGGMGGSAAGGVPQPTASGAPPAGFPGMPPGVDFNSLLQAYD